MTVSTTSSAATFLGNGSTQIFTYPFIMGSASNAVIYYVNAQGLQVLLSPSQYSITLNAPAPGAIWGIGGSVTYLYNGQPIANGTQLIVDRLLPLTQTTSISNQGNFYPEVIEEALDILCFEIQQVASRGGAIRGIWATGVQYNFGDIVQDGTNGAGTFNLYVCAIENTSGVWTTDLANGDWSLALNVASLQTMGSYLPLTGGTILGNLTVDGTTTLVGTTTIAGGLTGTTITNPTLSGGTINSTPIGGTTPAAATVNALTVLKTSSGAEADSVIIRNAASAVFTGTSIQFNPSSNTAKVAIIDSTNDGSDNIPVNIYTSTASSSGVLRASFLAAGGLNINSATGTTNAGDINIPGNYRINGNIIPQIQAWVKFTVSGTTVSIAASYNIASVTRNSAGDYTVNITNAITDANYALLGTAQYSGSNGLTVGFKNGTTPSTTAFEILTWDTANSLVDAASVSLSIVR